MCEHEFTRVIKTDGKQYTVQCLECGIIYKVSKQKQPKTFKAMIKDLFRKE